MLDDIGRWTQTFTLFSTIKHFKIQDTRLKTKLYEFLTLNYKKKLR